MFLNNFFPFKYRVHRKGNTYIAKVMFAKGMPRVRPHSVESQAMSVAENLAK